MHALAANNSMLSQVWQNVSSARLRLVYHEIAILWCGLMRLAFHREPSRHKHRCLNSKGV